ncbi:MAG: hypothetical protein V4437_02995 [Patescibacteria group bacterium]
MFKTIAKLRRAPYHAREHILALVTILIVGVITVIWFFSFVYSLTKTNFHTNTATTTPDTAVVTPKAPFSE